MATYLESAALRDDADFRKRLEIAVAKYAAYLLGEDPVTANHAARYRWAVSAIMNPSGAAGAVANAVILDDNIQTNLGASTDAQIQSAVEAKVNLILQ